MPRPFYSKLLTLLGQIDLNSVCVNCLNANIVTADFINRKGTNYSCNFAAGDKYNSVYGSYANIGLIPF